ncbi:unnamed protein product [marine sediment metagenome]|uniref:Flavodoxin-like domain-containing protein n=1 Tax=marine sediment metagenome TaxID=412755 RepID=X1CZY0_9ZZZZ
MPGKMAEYIAEGVRLTGNTAELKKISEIKDEKDIGGYDGFIFGCPTYHRDITAGMKTFLFLAEKANLVGKMILKKYHGISSCSLQVP